MDINKYSAEAHLLYLYFEGVPQHKQITEDDMRDLVDGLKKHRLKLYFSQYWDHQAVRQFKNKFATHINQDDVFYYLNKVGDLFQSRNESNIHWIEKINFFHFFGLLRIIGNKDRTSSGSYLNNFIKQREGKKKSLIDISALNTKCVIEERDAKDTVEIFNQIEQDPNLIRDFGHYQVFYHNGIYNCVNEFSFDMQKKGKVPIAHSVLALIVICDLYFKNEPELKEFIMDKLYYPLNESVKNKIDESSKKAYKFFSL